MSNPRPLSEAEQQIADFYQSPLGQEIIEVNKEAFINRQMAELQAKMDELINSLPPILRAAIAYDTATPQQKAEWAVFQEFEEKAHSLQVCLNNEQTAAAVLQKIQDEAGTDIHKALGLLSKYLGMARRGEEIPL